MNAEHMSRVESKETLKFLTNRKRSFMVYKDIFIRKWWASTPCSKFIYFDKVINVWFVIYTCNQKEYQGESCISYQRAYERLKAKLARFEIPDISEFTLYDSLEERRESSIRIL